MKTLLGWVVVFFAVAINAPCQPSGLATTFEVATIKPSPPTGHVGPTVFPGGRVKIGHSTLSGLIFYALRVETFQISGGPNWIYSDMYDVEAKPPTGSASAALESSPKAGMSDEECQMLLSLLTDRFKLRFHRETKDSTIYLLERNGKELKLTDAVDKNRTPWVGSDINGGMMTGTGMAAVNISMPVLAQRLIYYLGKRVDDKTGLLGSYDFSYHYSADEPHPDVVSSIITSLNSVGLRLHASKGPVEMIVIDSAEKPSAN
jgi:uncharacterized protein (TIGR03435 family)